MSLAGTSLNGIAGAFGRSLRGFGRKTTPNTDIHPYEPAPLNRDEMSNMFEVDDVDSAEPLAVAEILRASERLERDTMSMIRSALYPVEDPRSDSKT